MNFFLSLALVSVLMGSEPPPQLAFVHLGLEVPPSLFTAIRQARYFNPDCEIYLVTDQSAYFLFDRNFLAEEKISLINGDSLQITTQHLNFRKAAFHNHSIFYTLERFFYLFDLIEERKIENLFHIENDTLLYVELTELLPLFHSAQIRLATPFLSQMAAVPCFVFIKDLEALRPFIEYTLDWTAHAPRISDMKALAYYFRDFGQSRMTPLPTLMASYTHPKLESFVRSDNRTPLPFLSLTCPLFPGYLFDAATLGVYANGNDRKYDPKSGPGKVHFRSLFDPRHFSFDWGKDSKNRAIPYLFFEGTRYAIVNLHLHSKMAEGFSSYGEERSKFP